MKCEIPRDLQMPYLRAIQKIPGNTAGEKFSWIGRLALRQTNRGLEQVPPELLPILRVETAIKKKRHEDITSALKCEDLMIINRALKASWFFDGSHKKVVDVTYFCERLFPYVSVNTRMRIVITLAHRLSGKDPVFAQQMFTAVASTYSVQTAYPLFIACDEAFVYKMIVEKKLVLPVKIVSKIFRKNPNLIVRFLKLLKHQEVNERTPFAIGIDRYKSFLPKLIRRRVEDFVELYETHLPNIVLSNTCAEIFLKKARQHVIKKPLVYIRILPLKKINERLMESIFPDLLPADISNFYTNEILNYLKHYPRDKKYELLHKSYKNKYDADLLGEMRNITPALLRILPAEERIKQARINIEKKLEMYSCKMAYYESAWVCYLPVNEAIPTIKEKISKTSDEDYRFELIQQMIYACKVNGDDDALSDTLKYILKRHKNEHLSIIKRIFHQLLQLYDVPHLSEKQASLILDIVRLYYVKWQSVPREILMAMIHFNLIHNMSIEELINMYLEKNCFKQKINIFLEYPQYERQCLVAIGNIYQKKHYEDLTLKKYNFCEFVEAMNNFNDRCKRSRIKIEEMRIRDYPWLIDTIRKVIKTESFEETFLDLKDALLKNEPELYRSWLPEDIAEATSGAALALLKRDLQNILDNWESYLEHCIDECHYKRVQHFIRTTRWYKDLPIKFAEYCMDHVCKKHKSADKISSRVTILAILLHGDTMTKLIDPLKPTEATIDARHPNAKNNYKIMQVLSLSMKLSNPPVPLDFVVRLCKEGYLSIALMILTNVSRRTSLPKVISTAQEMINMRVSVRKHGIRLMCLASKHELMDFFQKTWTLESHYSIRQVLFKEIQKFFLTDPRPETWSLYCQTMSTLNLNDEALLLKMKLSPDIPNEYVVKYLDLWLKTIEDLQGVGLDVEETNIYIAMCLGTLTAPVLHLLPEEFAANILRQFLFYIDGRVSYEARRFTVLYILTEDKDKHATRFKEFADVLHNAVTTESDHLEKLCVHPVNKIMYLFINDFVASYVKLCFNTSINPQIIDNMQTLFSSVFSSKQDARSYLLLVYAKELQECKEFSSKKSWLNFGLKIGQQLHKLIDIFSSLLILFMAEILEFFLNDVYRDTNCGEINLYVSEGLIEAGNTNSYFMAAKLLSSVIIVKHKKKYFQLMEKFRGIHQEAAITAVLCNHIYTKKTETSNAVV